MKIKLQEIVCYPLKSMRGINLADAAVGRQGLPFDREWLLTDEHGAFVTARSRHDLLLWRAEPFSDGITLTAPDGERITVMQKNLSQQSPVTVWKDTFAAQHGDEQADRWLSGKLQQTVRINYLGRSGNRVLAYADTPLSFADGAPYLLTHTASLAALNQTLARPVEMRRFRPNLVIDGAEAYAEETWRRIRIGSVEFEIFKPCTRCVMTTVDLTSGEKAADQEPLKTLAQTRNAVFGVNMIALGGGSVRLGDEVEVLSYL